MKFIENILYVITFAWLFNLLFGGDEEEEEQGETLGKTPSPHEEFLHV